MDLRDCFELFLDYGFCSDLGSSSFLFLFSFFFGNEFMGFSLNGV